MSMSTNETTLPRKEARARRLAELRAQQQDVAAVEKMFPTAEPQRDPDADMTPGDVEQGELTNLAIDINYRFAQAERLIDRADDHRLTAALQLAKARVVCHNYKIRFESWLRSNIKVSYSYANKMAHIGMSDNPKQALLEYREKQAGYQLKSDRKRKQIVQAARAVTPGPFEPAGALEHQPDTNQIAKSVVDQATEAPVEPRQETEDFEQPTVQQLKHTAARAVLTLPATEARAVLAETAEALGLKVARSEEVSGNFFVTVDALLHDFRQLSSDDQYNFIRQACDIVGAVVELP